MNDHELNQLLHTWKVEPELPPSFQREVWRRLEAVEPQKPASPVWLQSLLAWLANPLPATVTCALALSAGLVVGGMVGGPPPPSAVAAYANSINPLTKVAPR